MTDVKNHPLQNLWEDPTGVIRFQENNIVSFLLKVGPFDLNQLACMNFSREDWEQFAQLIGYSVSSWGGLSYVSAEKCAQADLEVASFGNVDDESTDKLRIALLEERIRDLKEALKEPIAELYGLHPSTLEEGY